MFGLIGGAAIAACTVGDDPSSQPTNADWEMRAKQLEVASSVLYSASAEGRWTGKAGVHVPTVVMNGDGTVTASCTHGMIDADPTAMPPVAQHWITTMYARDTTTNTVIELVEFITRGPDKATTATMTFKIPPGTISIKVYAYCNQHDLWVTDEIHVR